uniref:Uncharacterized protein n=1 Tax=Arundo donax TaxID=35708 RepID=A0A0A9BNR3_ARUDO
MQCMPLCFLFANCKFVPRVHIYFRIQICFHTIKCIPALPFPTYFREKDWLLLYCGTARQTL